MKKSNYTPTKEDLQIAKQFCNRVENSGANLHVLLNKYAVWTLQHWAKDLHHVIIKWEESEAYKGGNIPISDIFESEVLNQSK